MTVMSMRLFVSEGAESRKEERLSEGKEQRDSHGGCKFSRSRIVQSQELHDTLHL